MQQYCQHDTLPCHNVLYDAFEEIEVGSSFPAITLIIRRILARKGKYMSLQPPTEASERANTPRTRRRPDWQFLSGIGLMLLGSGVAFAALYFQWKHYCPTPDMHISCADLGPADTQPFVPMPPNNPFALPQLLPVLLSLPVLGTVSGLLLILVARGRLRFLLPVLLLSGIVGICGFFGTQFLLISPSNDGAFAPQTDIGGYLSLLGYAAIIFGAIITAIAASRRYRKHQ